MADIKISDLPVAVVLAATGWAAWGPDTGICVDTVSTAPRAAMINWLVAHGGTMVTTDWSDDDVRVAFNRQATMMRGARLVPVRVEMIT